MKHFYFSEMLIMLSVLVLPIVLLMAMADASTGQLEMTAESLKLIASL